MTAVTEVTCNHGQRYGIDPVNSGGSEVREVYGLSGQAYDFDVSKVPGR
jgi:hypothetical protein